MEEAPKQDFVYPVPSDAMGDTENRQIEAPPAILTYRQWLAGHALSGCRAGHSSREWALLLELHGGDPVAARLNLARNVWLIVDALIATESVKVD